MTLKDIHNLLESTGIPTVYLVFDEQDVPDLPIISYQVPYSNNFSADGKVYKEIKHLQIDLYTKYKDEITEQKLEKVLSDFFWNKETEHLDKEKCFRIKYEMEV